MKEKICSNLFYLESMVNCGYDFRERITDKKLKKWIRRCGIATSLLFHMHLAIESSLNGRPEEYPVKLSVSGKNDGSKRITVSEAKMLDRGDLKWEDI
jgi:hypothetical protein